MVDHRPTRRRVLRAVAGTGLTVGAAGCLGTSSTGEGNTSENATTQPTASTPTASGTPTATTTSARQSTGSAPPSTSDNSTAPSGTPPATASGTERGTHTVGMYTELYFDPIGLYVEPGESVSFELVSGVHSAAAYHPKNEAAFERRVPEGTPAWDTGVFDGEGKFRTVAFETRGTHDYFCLPHKQLGMVGRIVVGEPGGPATETPNPDGGLPESDEIVEQGSISYEEFQADSQ